MKRGPKPSRRWPVEPVERLLLEDGSPEQHAQERLTSRPSARRVEELTGLTGWNRFRSTGLTTGAADRAAIALGRHPLELWPDFYEDVAS